LGPRQIGDGKYDKNRGAKGGSGIVIVRYPMTTSSIITNTSTYDADGNLTNDDNFAYSWDGENRLITAEPITPTNGSKKMEFQYDYMSRRTSKVVAQWDGNNWVGQSTNHFIYDAWNLISELQSTANSLQTNFYIWGLDLSGSLQGAGGIGGLLSATFNATNTVHYFYDANGNVTDLVDANGTSVASYQYDPYGKVVSSSGAMAVNNVFRFSTKYWDDDLDMGYWGYRWYGHPEEGRWTCKDPLGEKAFILLNKAMISTIRMNNHRRPNGELSSLNLYQTCHNDLLNRIDLNGLIDGSWDDDINNIGEGRAAISVWYTSGKEDACNCKMAFVRRTAYRFGIITVNDGDGSTDRVIPGGKHYSAGDQPGGPRRTGLPQLLPMYLTFRYSLICTEGKGHSLSTHNFKFFVFLNSAEDDYDY